MRSFRPAKFVDGSSPRRCPQPSRCLLPASALWVCSAGVGSGEAEGASGRLKHAGGALLIFCLTGRSRERFDRGLPYIESYSSDFSFLVYNRRPSIYAFEVAACGRERRLYAE
jgi:hypothetical protein